MKQLVCRVAATFNNCSLFFNIIGNYIRYCHKIYSLHFKKKKENIWRKKSGRSRCVTRGMCNLYCNIIDKCAWRRKTTKEVQRHIDNERINSYNQFVLRKWVRSALRRFLSFVFEFFDPSFAARSSGRGDQKCILNNQEAPDTPWK